MANIRLIKRRIRSVQSTSKITRAMEMVATSRMKRTQMRMLATRPYAEKMVEMLCDLAAQPRPEGTLNPLLERREVKNVTVVLITSDRGFCGGLNTNVNRAVSEFILKQSAPVKLITVGRKGRDFMCRRGQNVVAEFTGLGDQPVVADTTAISRLVIDDYSAGKTDLVYVAYPKFVNVVSQRPALEELLPVEPEAGARRKHVQEYIYEPSSAFVLDKLLPRYVEMEIFHAILETIASEQAARMVAMRNATDNANQIIQELTLVYNKARQEMITKELLDIAGGMAQG
ncbi:MAG: ATP synthase F1 subunit gamma [Dehalococcoidia bacterium]|nr:ATP synthase F1 subunit gamma [Dehalococcoidia bacterium]